MHVLFIAGREIEYSRNAVLLRAFEQFSTVDVIAANTTKPRLYTSNLRIVLQALVALKRQQYDLIFIGFYGHVILQLLAPFIRHPLLFDAFISNYDTLCFDRKLFAPHSLAGRLAFWLDQANGKRATHVLLDTKEHEIYFSETFGLHPSKISVLPVGCRDDIFDPQFFKNNTNTAGKIARKEPPTRVLYYCTYLPLHGVETVLNAAKMVEALPINFYLIGTGPLLKQIKTQAEELALQNLTFQPPMSVEMLAPEIARADISLGGHFGTSTKADRVVPGKIYQMLAMGSPIIATNTAANRSLLSHGKNAFLVPRKDPSALADAISTLHHDPIMRRKIADAGRQLYAAEASEQIITRRLQAIVTGLGYSKK